MAADVPHSAGFFAELRRRRVLRVVGFYAISVWLVLQVSNIVFPALYLPPWALTVVVVAIAAGFPIVAALAWVFDLTPQGLVRTGPAEPDMFGDPDVAIMDRPRIWIDIVIIGVLLAMIAYLLVRPDGVPVRGAEASIAVLPFVDMSPEGDNRYFSDGIAEELLDALVRVRGLQVAARTSSFGFREPHGLDIREIGERLGVATLLEGSVRRDGHRVRITVQLIDARTGYHMWSETYDRTLDDIFAVQDDIARSVVRALRVRLGSGEAFPLVVAPTADMDAYEMYLRGREALRTASTVNQIDVAIERFQDALDLDPRFAVADAGRCSAYTLKYEMSRDQEMLQRALDACRVARMRNTTSPEVHVALGWLHDALRRDDQALAFFAQALDLDANNVEALRGLGVVHARGGDAAAAETALRRVVDLDPHHWRSYSSLGGFYFQRGRFDEALEVFRRGAAAQPANPLQWSNIGGALIALGRREEAAEAFARSIAIEPSASALANAGTNQFFMGRFAEARALYEQATELAPHNYRLQSFLADACRQIPDGACESAALRRAVSLATREFAASPGDGVLSARLSWMYTRLGEASAAQRYLDNAMRAAPEDPEVMRHGALVALERGDVDEAISWLEGAAARGYSRYQLRTHPDFARLRNDPRFGALLEGGER